MMTAIGENTLEYVFLITLNKITPTKIPEPNPETNLVKNGMKYSAKVDVIEVVWMVVKTSKIRKGSKMVNGVLRMASNFNKSVTRDWPSKIGRIMEGAVPTIMVDKRSAIPHSNAKR